MNPDSERAKTSRLVLLAEGRVDSRWRKPFQQWKEKLVREVGEGRIDLAFLGEDSPSLLEAAEAAVQQGITDLIVLPLFLALANETEQAIPRQVVAVKERFPALGVILLPPIGEHPAVTEAILAVASATVR